MKVKGEMLLERNLNLSSFPLSKWPNFYNNFNLYVNLKFDFKKLEIESYF